MYVYKASVLSAICNTNQIQNQIQFTFLTAIDPFRESNFLKKIKHAKYNNCNNTIEQITEKKKSKEKKDTDSHFAEKTIVGNSLEKSP